MFLSNPRKGASDVPRRPARDLIEAVIENMRRNLEPLRYSILAPSRYLVYVHPAEYARLQSVIPVLQDETVRALAEELDALNRRAIVRRYADRIKGRRQPSVERAAAGIQPATALQVGRGLWGEPLSGAGEAPRQGARCV